MKITNSARLIYSNGSRKMFSEFVDRINGIYEDLDNYKDKATIEFSLSEDYDFYEIWLEIDYEREETEEEKIAREKKEHQERLRIETQERNMFLRLKQKYEGL